MENVSSSNGLEKRPKLRFPGFDEPYVLHRIGDIYAERSERGAADMELLSVTMNGGVMQRSEIEGKDNSSEDKSNYKVVRKGDMVYNSMRMWQGANGVSSYDGIVSPAYTVLTAKVSICNEYFAALFKNYKLINEFRKNSQGMTSDTWNLKYPQIETIKVYLPEVAEQEKVASMLVTLDKRIAAQATLVEQLKKYKRGLHKLVFIKNRKPSWEKSALHDIASFCGGGTPSKDVSSYWDGEIGWISSSDIQEEWIDDISVTRRITKKAIDNSATKLCPEGTIAIVSRVGVGKVAIIPESLCTSQDFTNITSITGNTHYMAYQIAFRMKLEAMKTQGTSIKGVTADTIKSMGVDIPPLEEQKKIADMLTAFDSYIKRAVYELDIFLTMKKALLQQLFI